MNIILTLGAPGSGYDAVFDRLVQWGVARAKPSSRGGETPHAIGTLLMHALGSPAASSHPGEQLRPSKVGHDLAADLALANQHKPMWGWADHQIAWLMDFWKEFDPQVRLLIVYASPEQHLMQSCHQCADLSSDEIGAALQYWVDWNTSLLRYHLRNPQRTILMHAQTALSRPSAMLQVLQSEWGLEGLTWDRCELQPDHDLEAVLATSALGLIPASHPAWNLGSELQSAASLPHTAIDRKSGGLEAWKATSKLFADFSVKEQAHGTITAKLQALSSAHVELQRDYKLALLQVRELQGELERCLLAKLQQHAASNQEPGAGVQPDEPGAEPNSSVLLQLRGEQDELERSLKQHRQDHASEGTRDPAPGSFGPTTIESDQASELLTLQLHQVQDELEHYFVQFQQLKAACNVHPHQFLGEFWKDHPPPVLVVDMRRPIVGEHWHSIESDGRWTGPGVRSTLNLPPLAEGIYLLEIDVVGAMAQDILEDVAAEIQGRSYPLEVEHLAGEGTFPVVCSAQVRVDDPAQHVVELQLRVSRTLSPAELGTDDQRQLGLCVQQVRMIRQAALDPNTISG